MEGFNSGVFLRDTKEQIQIGISGSLKKDMTGQAYIPGTIGLQVHGKREMSIYFRNIRAAEL